MEEMDKKRMVRRKSIAWINGQRVEGYMWVRKYKGKKKPQAIGRPAIMTHEQRVEFFAQHPTKPLRRPPRTRFCEETLQLLRERSRAMKEAYKKSLKKSA